MQKLLKNVKKRLSVFLILMPVLCVILTAQSVTQLPTEKKDLEDAARELTIEEVMKIAEEEIERTAQEAVKAALLEVRKIKFVDLSSMNASVKTEHNHCRIRQIIQSLVVEKTIRFRYPSEMHINC